MLNMNMLSKINESIGPAGLVGLDKLYSHMIKSELESLIASLQHDILNEKNPSDILNTLNNESTTANQPLKFYNNLTSKFTKFTTKVFELIMTIGQKQIVRKYISHELNLSCKFSSKNLESSLQTMNK